MAEIVNLNKFRKAKDRAEEIRRAEESRAVFGLPKKKREEILRSMRRAAESMDQKKLD